MIIFEHIFLLLGVLSFLYIAYFLFKDKPKTDSQKTKEEFDSQQSPRLEECCYCKTINSHCPKIYFTGLGCGNRLLCGYCFIGYDLKDTKMNKRLLDERRK